MDINLARNEIIQKLALVNDPALLEMIGKILDHGIENQTNRISMEQYNRELGVAEAEIAAGEWVSQEEMKYESEKW